MPQTSDSLQQLSLPPAPPRPWRFRDFPILAWWAPPGAASEADFRTYKDAGFTLCTVNSDGDYARGLEMAARARLPVMAYRQCQGFSAPKPAAPPDFAKDAENVVGWITNDEPGGYGAVTEAISAVNALMREDPTRRALFNMLPPGAQRDPDTDAVIAAAVRNGLPILSYDSYVIYQDGHDNAEAHFRYLERFRQASLRYGVPFWAFALSIRHFAYRRPSESDIRWTHFTNLAYGAKGLWYFTYWGPVGWKDWDDVAIVDPRNGRPTELYGYVRTLNRAVRDMGRTLLGLVSTGVFHTAAAPPPEQQPIEAARGWIASVRAQDALVGFFRDARGADYALLVNKLHGKNKSAAEMVDDIEIAVAPSIRKVTAVSWLDGKPGDVALKDGRATLRIAGGTGVLLRAE